MIDKIIYRESVYPKFQSEGYASQFVIPFASKVCKGIGVDIGCNKLEWMYAGNVINSDNVSNYDVWYHQATISSFEANSFPIDPVINSYNATKFPDNCKELDYIFSSHCLEHIIDWVSVLDYWTIKLKEGGVLFLYLPDYTQVYWRPWNNRKHLNILSPKIIEDYLTEKGYKYIKTSGVDLNNSFVVIAEK